MLKLFALTAACAGLGYIPLAALQVRIPGPGGEGAAPSVGCTPASGYSYCRQLTVNGSQVGGSTLINFGVLVNATLGASRIQNSGCYDVIFTSDPAGTAKIPWEIEECKQSTGAIVAWAGLGSVSASANTVFYVSYDNSSISAAQNTGANAPCNVWDSSYVRVFHLGNGASLSLNDSTCNAYNLTTNTGLTAGTGQADGAALATASNSDYATGPDTGLPSGGSARTIESWFNVTSFTSPHDLFQFGTSGTSHELQNVELASNQIYWAGWSDDFTASTTLTAGSWYYFVGTYDGTSTATMYVSNSSLGAHSQSWNTTLNGTFYLGKDTFGGAQAIYGYIDEFRISTIARSTGYITAQYNQMQTGSTFLTVGSEY
jgi:hypothetical protein